jgi:hypothetical protein
MSISHLITSYGYGGAGHRGRGLFIRRQMRRLAPRAEAAYPGPLD